MRILIVAPHADDEALGCGGLIARRRAEGHDVEVVVATLGDVRRGDAIKSSAATRQAEMVEAASILGIATPTVMYPGLENRLDTLPLLDLIGRIDALVGDGRYDQVLAPYPSHHQDHRRVFEACHAALRERGTGRPSLYALYEYSQIVHAVDTVPAGRLYVDITEHMAKKRAAVSAYRSQIGAAPHPLSTEAMEALARQRGFECGKAFAELYYVLRIVDA